MKKILLLASLLLSFALGANAQQFQQSQVFTVSSTSGAFGSMLQNSNVANHTFVWTVTLGTGAVSSCAFQLQTSPDNVTFTNQGASQTCTTSGTYSLSNISATYIRVNVTALTITGNATVALTYQGYATAQASGATDGVWNVPFGACGAALTTGAYAANPANSGALSAPSMVRVAAGEQLLQVTTSGAASALTLDCDITPPSRTTTGKGVTVTGYQIWYGVQTTALSSITAPTVNTITFPATGGSAAGTVASAGGSLTVTPGTLQLATTTSGQCYSANVAFGTPVVLNSANVRLETTWVFNQTAASAAVYQICGLQVFYNNNIL